MLFNQSVRSFSSRLRDFAYRLLDDGEEMLPFQTGQSRQDLEEIIKAAKREWLQAQAYFENAVEPELVDHAILSVQVAERKYMYWLKQIRNME